ncbi:MAG: hypothetical protein KC422_14925, partial [Trueperaceae bacterium]|nr:hypothetical protein [Trueperaceae bacterium]
MADPNEKGAIQQLLDWGWDKFAEPLAKKSAIWAKNKFDWKSAEQNYAERIKDRYGKLLMLGRANAVP